MLYFIPYNAVLPWSYIYVNLFSQVPAGTAYAQQIEVLPYSDVVPTEFLVLTDHYVPTQIYLNNRLIANFVPTSSIFRIKIFLNAPPNGNDIVVENGIDEQVNYSCTSTLYAGFLEGLSRELYQYLNYTLETYYSAMSSPWATFYVEYQLPWKHLLPDVMELRILAVKLASNCLFGEFGEQGGVTDLASSFCLSTPAIVRSTNSPADAYMPDLVNPTLSGSDAAGFEMHVWFMNKCLNRWLAFTWLLNNLDVFRPTNVSEASAIFEITGTGLYKQHLFDTTGPDCSVLGLIDFLGCLDRWSVTLDAQILFEPALCFFAQADDTSVQLPGLGGTFLDSGTELDGPHGPFDGLYDVDMLTDYWLGTPITDLDFGGCLPGAGDQEVTSWSNADCCTSGPPTTLFATTRIDAAVTSPVAPVNPLFGGVPTGLLVNETFNDLALF